jgi:SlyX protein
MNCGTIRASSTILPTQNLEFFTYFGAPLRIEQPSVNQPTPLEQRLVELEIKLTYQQKLIDELNGVVTEQTMKIFRLEKKLGEFAQQTDQIRMQLRDQLPNLPHEKPPHY